MSLWWSMSNRYWTRFWLFYRKEIKFITNSWICPCPVRCCAHAYDSKGCSESYLWRGFTYIWFTGWRPISHNYRWVLRYAHCVHKEIAQNAWASWCLMGMVLKSGPMLSSSPGAPVRLHLPPLLYRHISTLLRSGAYNTSLIKLV